MNPCSTCGTLRETRKHCIQCKRKYDRDYRAANVESIAQMKKLSYYRRQDHYKEHSRKKYAENKTRSRSYFYKSKYGITVETYNTLLQQQQGVCKICKNPESLQLYGVVAKLAVDHCHTTGRVRGLLCKGCNQGIGLLKDSVAVLSNAIIYLKHSGK